MTRFISFNINGIRARPHQLEALKGNEPDVIGLQETKVHDEAFPQEMAQEGGYQAHFYGQKAHYGVALLSKCMPTLVVRGFGNPDEQRRMIHARYRLCDIEIDVINSYFPQGESRKHPTKFPMKADYYAALTTYIQGLLDEGRHLVVMGDMNICPQDIDIGIGEKNAKRWLSQGICAFLPEERLWYADLLQTGLVDTYRHLHPDTHMLSWFDYRSRAFFDTPRRGLRIDHILCSPSLVPVLEGAGVSLDIRAMEKPSDHAPVWANFNLKRL